MSENNERISKVTRTTKETDITATFNLDGKGRSEINTGIGFFDHMLDGFTRHGLFDMKLTAKGDTDVDCHHTIEDTGIVIGEAISKAAGDKKSIKRFGYFILPMDDALILCAVDLSGRPHLNFEVDFPTQKCGDLDTEMIREFFYAVSYSAGMNIHIKQLSGINSHHIAEASFKAFAKSLAMAVEKDPRIEDVLSTKGKL